MAERKRVFDDINGGSTATADACGPELKKNRVLRGYTRPELAVAFFAGLHPRAGKDSKLPVLPCWFMREAFARAVPALDLSQHVARGDVALMTKLVTRDTALEPDKFKAAYKKAGSPDLMVGARCFLTVMHGALDHENEDLVRYLCGEYPFLLRVRASGDEPIHYAVSHSNLACIKALIECGANVNAFTPAAEIIVPKKVGNTIVPAQQYGPGTALDIAISRGNAEIVDYLIASGGCLLDHVAKLRLRNENRKVPATCMITRTGIESYVQF